MELSRPGSLNDEPGDYPGDEANRVIGPAPGLEDSLAQIEQLAAELAALAAETPVDAPPATPSETPSVQAVEVNEQPARVARRPIVVPHQPVETVDAPKPAPRRPRPLFSSCGGARSEPAAAPVTPRQVQRNQPGAFTPQPMSTPFSRPADSQPARSASADDATTQLPKLATIPPDRPATAQVNVRLEPPVDPFDEDHSDEPLFVEPITETDADLAELAGERRRRRRKWLIGALAAVLAVPAFAIGAVQPWLDSKSKPDEVAVADPGPARRPMTVDSRPAPAIGNDEASPLATPAPASGDSGDRGNPPPPGTTDRPTPSTSIRRGPASGLAVTARISNTTPVAGESVQISVSWRDGEGQVAGYSQSWGDGSPIGDSVAPGSCHDNPADQSGTETFSHAYTAPGTYNITLTTVTYTCDGATERQQVTFTLTVTAPPTTDPPETPTSTHEDRPSTTRDSTPST